MRAARFTLFPMLAAAVLVRVGGERIERVPGTEHCMGVSYQSSDRNIVLVRTRWSAFGQL